MGLVITMLNVHANNSFITFFLVRNSETSGIYNKYLQPFFTKNHKPVVVEQSVVAE